MSSIDKTSFDYGFSEHELTPDGYRCLGRGMNLIGGENAMRGIIAKRLSINYNEETEKNVQK